MLDVRAREVNLEMKMAAAKAIADSVPANQLHEEYLMPNVFDRTVAREVAAAAQRSGVARRPRQRARVSASSGIG